MKLELRRAVDGTHFVICVCGERTNRQLVIPLSPELSGSIQRLCDAEGVGSDRLLIPPHLRGRRHEKLSS